MLKLTKIQKNILLRTAQGMELDECDTDFYDKLNQNGNISFLISLLKSKEGSVSFGIITEDFSKIFTALLQESWRDNISKTVFNSINARYKDVGIEQAVCC